jgi:hypothetical protein
VNVGEGTRRLRCTLRAKDDSVIGHFTFELRFLRSGTFN